MVLEIASGWLTSFAKPNTQPTTPDAPIVEPNALADSVTVKAGVVAVRQWMAEGKGKG